MPTVIRGVCRGCVTHGLIGGYERPRLEHGLLTEGAHSPGKGCRRRVSLTMAIINWNGSDLPDALRPLPAGRYIVEALDDSVSLTPEEEDGLIQALDSLRAGHGIDHDDVRARTMKLLAT